jgi:hypothetical protein
MKRLKFLFPLLFLTINLQSQPVKIVEHKYQSDIIIYLTQYEYEADLKISITSYIYEAKNTPGFWFIVKNNEYYHNTLRVYLTKYSYEADFKAYITKYRYNIEVPERYKIILKY